LSIWYILLYFLSIWYILLYFWPFGIFWYILRSVCIFYGHSEYSMIIWYILPHFGMLYQ
jgi:hypothetical protein